MAMREIVLVAANVRSAHNVGSLLRTADGLGIKKVYLSGYTPYPHKTDDQRLPHEAKRVDARISKTALGAEKSMEWEHSVDITGLLKRLRADGYFLAALEQSDTSIKLDEFEPSNKIALVIGSEVGGLPKEILEMADKTLEIPMRGRKESFNVSVAAAIALYHLARVDK